MDLERKRNRREVLKEIATWGGSIGIGAAGGTLITRAILSNLYDTSSKTPAPDVLPTPSFTYSPRTATEAARYMDATATAMVRRGELTSFHPEGTFTSEVFSKVANSVFIMELQLQDGRQALGTAWLAHQKDNEFGFVTANHLTEYISETKRVNVWRPQDKSKVELLSAKAAKNPYFQNKNENTKDISVLKGVINRKLDAKPLAFQDNVVPSEHEKLLLVGYPYDFYDQQAFYYRTQGAVYSVESIDPNLGIWSSDGVSNQGASGSPVVTIRNGEPVVIGNEFGGAYNETTKELRTRCTTLNVGELLAKV